MKPKRPRNPNMRIGKPVDSNRVLTSLQSMPMTRISTTFLERTGKWAADTEQALKDELSEARWQRTNAYNIGRLPPRFIQGKEVTGGFRNSCDDDIRRLYCDMWVRSLHKLHKLILGLAPDPDDTEREFPLKGV